jgi:hypothetical protein
VELLLSAWENEQESFLRSNANRLRSSPSKAWNAYSIFLTRSECPADKQSALLNVEEDFHGTRKIARAGIAAKTDIFRALFPLLPIQHAATLKAETAVQALRERLPLRPEEKSAVVNGLSAQDILLAFLAEEEDL